jgi:predicted nucleic acid-binding protein
MSDLVADSSVVVKWVMPETDSDRALRLLTDLSRRGERVIVLDLAFVEVGNAIWKRCHRGLATAEEAEGMLDVLERLPLAIEPARPHLRRASEIARTYDRSLYDALFIALADELGLPGVTADGPLHQAVRADFPGVTRLRDWP